MTLGERPDARLRADGAKIGPPGSHTSSQLCRSSRALANSSGWLLEADVPKWLRIQRIPGLHKCTGSGCSVIDPASFRRECRPYGPQAWPKSPSPSRKRRCENDRTGTAWRDLYSHFGELELGLSGSSGAGHCGVPGRDTEGAERDWRSSRQCSADRFHHHPRPRARRQRTKNGIGTKALAALVAASRPRSISVATASALAAAVKLSGG